MANEEMKKPKYNNSRGPDVMLKVAVRVQPETDAAYEADMKVGILRAYLLKPGGLLDGALVTRVERGAYNQPATYDLLPSGGTGFYWANGILIGSTLSNP